MQKLASFGSLTIVDSLTISKLSLSTYQQQEQIPSYQVSSSSFPDHWFLQKAYADSIHISRKKKKKKTQKTVCEKIKEWYLAS